MRGKMIKRLIIMIMALVCTGAVFYGLWREGAFLPKWVSWENMTVRDGRGVYTATLRRGQVTVGYDDSVIWTSPGELKVQQILFGDVDHDGGEELLLLCWKIGRFGESRPFWVEKDERKWSQHIYVYQCRQGKVKPRWMSSYIGQDVTEMSVRDRLLQADPEQKQLSQADSEQKQLSQADPEQKQLSQADPERKQLSQADPGQKQFPQMDLEKEAEDRRESKGHLLLTDPEGKISSWLWTSWGFTREETEVSFVVFGDNLIHEPIYRYGLHNGGNFDFLYEAVTELIERNDVAVINQETPLVDDPAMYGDYPRFGTPVQVGEAIVEAGFDVVTCGTNHALDRGAAGVTFTKKFFEEQGLVCLGIQAEEEQAYQPYQMLVRNGIRVALFNYTYGTNGLRIPEKYPYMVHLLEDEEKIRAQIEAARRESDIVLVFAHWGTEYAEEADDFQRKWAQIFLESGVDVVVGTHPHALQPYEILQDQEGHEMLVYYSIGNYVSAQYEQSCVKGGAAQFSVSLTTDGYRITQYSLQPLEITHEKGKYKVALLES